MAHPIKRVTNEEVLATMRDRGMRFPDNFNTSGAQNSTFAQRVIDHLNATGQYTPDIFAESIERTKDVKQIQTDPNLNNVQRLSMALEVYGVSGEQRNDIIRRAQELSKTSKGIREGGKGEPSDLDFANAITDIIGPNHPNYQKIFNTAKTPAPVPPGGAPGAPAPAAAPPGTPTTGRPLAGGRNVLHHGPARPTGKAAPATAGGPGAGGGGGGGGGGIQGLPANAPWADVEAYFRKNYGAEAWMLAIPDFKDIITQVGRNPSGWTASSIVSAVQATPWWQSNGQNVADYLKVKANDPVGFKQALGTKTTAIKGELARFGITLPDDRIAQLGDESYKWGWTADQIAQHVADEFTYHEGQHSVFIDKMQTDAKNYFVPISEGTLNLWGDKLITGGETEAGNWSNFLKEQAKGMFRDPDIQRRLDAGETMTDIAKPYASLAASTLEMDEKDINFMDPKWMSALDQVDDKGNHTAMSPADWTRKIKTDEVYRYDYTEGAKQQGMSMATGLLKRFGAIA